MRLAPFVLLLAALPVRAQQTAVLFIGNSYTYVNDLPDMFRQIALSLGDTVSTGMQAPGGYTLQDHTYDPATQAAIASQQWDYVVLQEQSQFGALPTFEAYTDVAAETLTYKIQLSSECGYPVFYMTWGRENGDATWCPQYPHMCTYAGMQQALRDNYIQLALDNEGYVSPVGWAWKLVRDTHPNIELYQADESHPSVSGTYLAACVFYCTLFRESCVGASFTSTLQPDSAAILQAIASATVLDSLDTWNMNEVGSTDARYVGLSSTAENNITFHHFGQGQHWWICSNGQTSSDANPTFTFDAAGIYTFTHVYIDPCGHMDTDTWTIQVNATGMDEHVVDKPWVNATDQGMLTIGGGSNGDLFEVFDPQGRMVRSATLDGTSTHLPYRSGIALWRITTPAGARWNGKVLVP
ncbi:MAG: DUF4886 domain-containing protein [Flavobacteriales bacterium]